MDRRLIGGDISQRRSPVYARVCQWGDVVQRLGGGNWQMRSYLIFLRRHRASMTLFFVSYLKERRSGSSAIWDFQRRVGDLRRVGERNTGNDSWRKRPTPEYGASSHEWTARRSDDRNRRIRARGSVSNRRWRRSAPVRDPSRESPVIEICT